MAPLPRTGTDSESDSGARPRSPHLAATIAGRRATLHELLELDPALDARAREVLLELAAHGGERTVQELARALGVPVHHLYEHLASLSERGLIARTRKRNPRAYRIAPPEEFLERLTSRARDLLRAAEGARPFLEERYSLENTERSSVARSDGSGAAMQAADGLALLTSRLRSTVHPVWVASPDGSGVLETLGVSDLLCRVAGRLPAGFVRVMLPPLGAHSNIDREVDRLRAHGIEVRRTMGLESTIFTLDRELFVVHLPGAERSEEPPSVLPVAWAALGHDLSRLLEEEWARAEPADAPLGETDGSDEPGVHEPVRRRDVRGPATPHGARLGAAG